MLHKGKLLKNEGLSVKLFQNITKKKNEILCYFTNPLKQKHYNIKYETSILYVSHVLKK